MKFQGIRLLSLFAALPLLFLLVHCGAGTAIEQQFLDTGENIVLKFDGPFSYQYKTVGKGALITHNNSTQDSIQLLNNYSDNDPQDTLFESLIAHAGITYDNKLSIILGPDMNLKLSNGAQAIPDGTDEAYKDVAYVTNLKHPEDGEISFDAAIEFSKNLVGVSTIRKEIICVDNNGKQVTTTSSVPNFADCPYGSNRKATGKWLTFDYPVEQLKQLLGTSTDHKNDLIVVWHKGDPLTLTLQNIKAPNIVIDPSVLANMANSGNKPIMFNPSLFGSNANGNSSGNPPSGNTGNTGGNDNSGATGGGDQGGNVAVDTKVGGDSNVSGQNITTGGTSNAATGGKGCSLAGPSAPTQASAEGIFLTLNLLALALLRRGIKDRA